MEDIKAFIDWKGPFAETPNEFYQKCFELFKQFLENIKQQDLEVDLAHLKTKSIYELLIENKKVRPVVETKYPLINFKKIYKDFSKIQIQASDLDLAYKVMHRSINVKAKLKRLKIVTDDTCPLCYNASETIEHLFVHCQIVQKVKKYLEDMISNTVRITLDEFNSLQCVYPAHLDKTQTTVIHAFSILFHNAIWRHRNEVIFLNKNVNEDTIVVIFRCKIVKFLQVKRYQMEEYEFREDWGNINDKINGNSAE